jgi:GNAT superfamily N-acetyltransferase
MMDDVFIIKPTKEDIKSAYDVFEVSIRDAFEKEGLGDLKEDILAEIENKSNLFSYSLDNKDLDVFFLVAKLDERVIGTISFGPCGTDIKKCTNHELDAIGELGSLYVLPHYQGHGVGSILIHAMIKYLHELGIEQFCLDSG